jgi:hypothetical protein
VGSAHELAAGFSAIVLGHYCDVERGQGGQGGGLVSMGGRQQQQWQQQQGGGGGVRGRVWLALESPADAPGLRPRLEFRCVGVFWGVGGRGGGGRG